MRQFLKFFSARFFRHLIIWIILIAYELCFILITTKLQVSLIHLVIYYVLNIGLFYFNANVLLEFAFFHTKRRYLNAICLILAEMAVYITLKYLLDVILTSHNKAPAFFPLTTMYLSYNLWRGFYFIGLSIAYFSTVFMERFRDRNYQMEKEQLVSKAAGLELENKYIIAENAYLQNQISPHLLFNTLNFIYNTVYLKSEKAGQGVMMLSDLMRYSLVSGEKQDTVALTDEVEQINNLIGLSRLRFDEELVLNFKKKGKLKEVRIIPLLLVTLVENMVKHGDLWDLTYPAVIRLIYSDNRLLFETTNKKRSGAPYLTSGIGLKNLEKRLNNHYGERYNLLITDVNQIYTVKLSLEL